MQLTDNTRQLEQLCQRLSAQPFITVDLEFIREKTYFPILCLIQVASEEETAIIDPLAEGLSLAPFFELMKNRSVVKVFHSCRQDVEIIYGERLTMPGEVLESEPDAIARRPEEYLSLMLVRKR